MYALIYVRKCEYIFLGMYRSTFMCIFVWTYVFMMYVCLYVLCKYVRMHICTCAYIYICLYVCKNRLCGLVVRVSGYRFRGPGFDPRYYQIFCVVVGLERGPLSLVSSIEELLELKSSGSRSRKQRLTAVGTRWLTTWHPSIRKIWH